MCELCWRLVDRRIGQGCAAASTVAVRSTLGATVVAQASLARSTPRDAVVDAMRVRVAHVSDGDLLAVLRDLALEQGAKHPLVQRWRDVWRLYRAPAQRSPTPVSASATEANALPAAGETASAGRSGKGDTP